MSALRDKKGRFVKGHKVFPGTEKTRFKKGNIKPNNAHAWKPLEKHPRWKGGRLVSKLGYVFLMSPNHPHRDDRGYYQEHRLVMESHIGRVLLPSEVVHHINAIRTDNRIENLMLFSNNTEHLRHHAKIKKESKNANRK